MDESGNYNSQNSSATHDIKNEITTYLLSSNQRLANIRLNNQSEIKIIIHKRPFRIMCDILLKNCVLSPFANGLQIQIASA